MAALRHSWRDLHIGISPEEGQCRKCNLRRRRYPGGSWSYHFKVGVREFRQGLPKGWPSRVPPCRGEVPFLNIKPE